MRITVIFVLRWLTLLFPADAITLRGKSGHQKICGAAGLGVAVLTGIRPNVNCWKQHPKKGGIVKKSKFTQQQIIAILDSRAAFESIPALCKEHGISRATYYLWIRRYLDDSSHGNSKAHELEMENIQLRQVCQRLEIENRAIRNALNLKP
ncbi:transposase [Paraburkholderia sp. CNPSo 3281]|uniref:transposase n=1 Tax=Paraburkholderia sp. CNPSo 3281 TaxID=2940933 RepID=UPI0035CCD081